MLQIVVPIGKVMYNEATNEFIYPEERILQLEHSLISLSKWESKWNKPFLHTTELTPEETLDYIKYMTINKNIKPDTYDYLTQSHINQIIDYIGAPMTATTFAEDKKGKPDRERITAEIVYYWMVALNIPFDPCEKWHLNRLITLIRVCNIKNQPPSKKKKSQKELLSEQAAINARNRQRFKPKG